MPTEDANDPVQVGEWRVEPATDTLSRDRETLKLEPRTMRLLLCLAGSAGEVISVDRLLSEVWSGVVVGPASVYQAVSQLRKLLGDVEAEPTYIATVPRKGYRLIAPVHPIERLPSHSAVSAGLPPPPILADAASATPDQWPQIEGRATSSSTGDAGTLAANAGARRSFRAIASALAVLVVILALGWFAAEKFLAPGAAAASIVVLPFIDMTADKINQPFCDGLTEELSNWLAQIPTLKVVARTSAFAYRKQGEDVRAIGRSLGTNHVLEGSLRRFGDHMRVTVQLIDARSGYHLWSANYDRPMDDTIKVQDDISRSVAQNLEIRLTADTAHRFASRGKADARAYQTYLRARYFQQQRNAESNARAIVLYEEVIKSDPGFALAYVGLSYAHLNELWLNDRPISEVAPEVEPLIASAMQIDKQLSDVYTVRAALRSSQYRVKEARDDLQTAVSLNPNDSKAFAQMGRLLIADGQPRKAFINLNHAVDLDPLDFRLQTQLCTALEDVARYAEARASCGRARELQPDSAEAADASASLAWAQGFIDEALRWNADALKLGGDVFGRYWDRADMYLDLGLESRAREVLTQGNAATHETDSFNAALTGVAFLHGGPDELRNHLEKSGLEQSAHSAELMEAAYSHLLLGEDAAAKKLIDLAMKAPELDLQSIDSPWSARQGQSAGLIRGVAEIRLGDRAAGQEHLNSLVSMLNRMIGDGVDRYLTYQLRAQANAMLGNPEEAMRDLTRAVDLGWRRVWWAEHEPYFTSLQKRADFKKLMMRVSRSNDRLLVAAAPVH